MNAIVIMAGGVGTRLFPASSAHWPKQFVQWPTAIDPSAENNETKDRESLLQETYWRLRPLAEPGQMFVVAPPEFVEPIRTQLPELPAENILVEPFRRNSAGACALATARILARFGEDAT
ncbi:MAG: sugar phosphate nucleotidyltransferase, partial [Armatimonadota bacterium]|nr:sugar phosphate nucleotidyltransferase [Armatimonadota bacterium]